MRLLVVVYAIMRYAILRHAQNRKHVARGGLGTERSEQRPQTSSTEKFRK